MKKPLSDDAILLRVRKYCAFRERSVKEVRKKLVELEVQDEYIPNILKKLENEGFLNETRYVSAFAGGKFRTKKWGKRKIEMELKKQGISEEMLDKGLSEIKDEDYVKALDDLLRKKWRLIQTKKNIEHFELFTPETQKLINYAMQKGYEYDLIIKRIKQPQTPKGL